VTTKKRVKQGSDPIKESFRDKHKYLYDAILLILGAILGFSVTFAYGYFQDCQVDKYTAQGIYKELSSENETISGLAYTYQSGIYLDGVHQNNPHMLYGQPLFSSDSVYPAVNSEIERFDPNLANNITAYYSHLSSAEQYRLQLVETQKINSNLSSLSWGDAVLLAQKPIIQQDMENDIIYCANQIPIIKKQLNGTYGVF